MSIIREFARFIEPTGELEYDNTVLNNLSASTIQSAIDELSVLVGAGNVGSQATFSVYEFVATASQTTFDLAGTFTLGGDITAGNFVIGETYKIQTLGDTDWNVAAGTTGVTYNVGDVFTADAVGSGTGVVRVAVTYPPGYIQVFVNGIFMAAVDYTASNGRTVVLAEPAELSDLITVVILDSFDVATQLRVLDVNASAPDNSLAIDNVGDVSVVSDIKLADNGKVIFGDSSDLQIYHNGSDSFITDNGTGDLKISGEAQIKLGSVGGEFYATFNNNASVNLYYDNVLKLETTATGIDVTGTVTADGLTVDGTATIDGGASANTVLTLDSSTANTYLKITDLNSTNGTFIGATTNDLNFYPNNVLSATFAAGGDISFYDTAGNNAKFFWDASAESLGIGTQSPAEELHIYKAATDPRIRISHGTNTVSGFNLGYSGQDVVITNTENGVMLFGTNNIERMRIDSSGVVQISNATPTLKFTDTDNNYDATIQGLSGSLVLTADSGAEFGTESIQFKTGASERMRIDSGGVLGLGNTPQNDWYSSDYSVMQIGEAGGLMSAKTEGNLYLCSNAKWASDASWEYIVGTEGAFVLDMQDTIPLRFRYAASGTADTDITWSEAFRVDTSGNLLVGNLTYNSSNTGVLAGADGALFVTRDGDTPAQLNRLTSFGDIVIFQKDTTPYGSIKIQSGNRLSIHGTSGGGAPDGSGLYFGANVILPTIHTGVATDATVDLGQTSPTNYRFKDLHLSGGVYLGGTGAANYLDDYEEGDYVSTLSATSGTPTVSSTEDTLGYTKIGDTVTITGQLGSVDCSGCSGELKITMPFLTKDLADRADFYFAHASTNQATVGISYFYIVKSDVLDHKWTVNARMTNGTNDTNVATLLASAGTFDINFACFTYKSSQ